MTDDFYRTFEDAHRGRREDIQQRLRVYLPFLCAARELGATGDVLDLGCGRGEWLALMREHRFQARGVDLDEGMLRACVAEGLAVIHGDALAQLRQEPDASLLAVTAFHLAEHLPHEMLQSVVREAHRALVPGGLLILETPNPENIQVATTNFHLDPSHLKPLPPMILEFTARFHGFERACVLRLQENPGLIQAPVIGLMDVLGGVSPDYAVVASTAATGHDTTSLDRCFAQTKGLSLSDLAQRFDAQSAQIAMMVSHQIPEWQQQTQHRQQLQSLMLQSAQERLEKTSEELRRLQHQAKEHEGRLGQALEASQQTQSQLTRLDVQLQAAHAHFHAVHAQLNATQAQLNATQAQLSAVYRSVSWRVSAPVRWVRPLLKRLGLFNVARSVYHRLRGLSPEPPRPGPPPSAEGPGAAPAVQEWPEDPAPTPAEQRAIEKSRHPVSTGR